MSLADLPQTTPYLLHRLVHALDRVADTRLQATIGVSYRRFMFLAVLAHQEAPTQHELAIAQGVSDAAVSLMTAELEKAGLVEVTPSPVHGRKRTVMLTRAGARVVARGDTELRQAFSEIVASSRIDEDRLADDLKDLYAAIRSLEGSSR